MIVSIGTDDRHVGEREGATYSYTWTPDIPIPRFRSYALLLSSGEGETAESPLFSINGLDETSSVSLFHLSTQLFQYS